MKKKILLLIIFAGMVFNTSRAQIVLDTVFPYTLVGPSYQLIRLEKSGYKWLITSHPNHTMTFLNMDHSLFRQFSFQADSGTNLTYSIEYISEVLFDNDSTDIEYLMDYSQWPNSHHYIKIMDETGNLLLYRDSATTRYGELSPLTMNTLTAGITNTDSGAIMLLAVSENVSNLKIEAYKLPGYYECSVCADQHLKLQMPMAVNPGAINNPASYLNVYPNPSTGATTIEYHLPSKYKTGTLTIIDMSGHSVKSYSIRQQASNVIIEKGTLPAGTYTCIIKAGDEIVSEKFITIN